MHKPRLRKSVLLLTLIITLLLIFSSCSAVFTASLGGNVWDEESEAGIADMDIYAYTNPVQREDDFKRYTGGTFNPNYSAGHVAKTSSAVDGSFVFDRIIWESVFPEFGKTADFKDIALLFYHEDYGLQKNSNPVRIDSDSNNNSKVDEEFKKINQTTDIEISLKNIANKELLEESFDIRLTVEQGSTTKVERATIRREGTISVTYPAEWDKTTVTITATRHNSSWKQCDENGKVIQDGDNPPSFEDVKGSIYPITLYLKQQPYDYPLISGEIDSENRDGSEKESEDNGLTVWLSEWADEGKSTIKKPFEDLGAQATTRHDGTGANNSVIRHGIFRNLGRNMSWEDPDYYKSGKIAKKEVLLVVDKNKDGELSAGDYYYEFTIRSGEEPRDLGKLLEWDALHPNRAGLKEVEADHVPKDGGN